MSQTSPLGVQATPSIPTSFVTDNSSKAVPSANILNLLTTESTTNNNNGIQSSASGNTVTTSLTNRATGQVTTTDATPTTIITLPLSTLGAAVYSVSGYVTGIIPSTGFGCSYFFDNACRTTGAAATEIGTEYPTTFEDVSLSTANLTVTTSGNNLLINVIGVVATTIDWDGYLTFRQVS